ncbi:MAG: type II secretion system protein [Planctomycetota bacterium]
MRMRKHGGAVTLAELILLCVVLCVASALFIPSWAASRRKSAEARAQSALTRIVSAQGVWRQTDLDRNGSQDYWTLDVAGLYGVQRLTGGPCATIGADVARMDSSPAASYSGLQTQPDLGEYALIAMTSDENKSAYVELTGAPITAAPLAGRVATNTSRYGFCAYPVGSTRKVSAQFVMNEEGVVYRVEGLPAPVVSFSSACPPDPPLGHG